MRIRTQLWVVLILVGLVVVLGGCGKERSWQRIPDPTPTPSSTPTPSPSPTATPTPSPSPSPSPTPMALQVQIQVFSVAMFGTQSLDFGAIVIGDADNAGVDWDVTCSVEDCGEYHAEDDGRLYYTAPNVEGPLDVTIHAASITNATVTDQKTITVLPAAEIAITTTQDDIPDGTVGYMYSARFEVTHAVGTVSYSLAGSGSLPEGLTLDGMTGNISGIPTSEATRQQFGVTASDSDDATATKYFSLTIRPFPSGENNALLNGDYAFLFRGGVEEAAAASMIGHFSADGEGHILAGELYLGFGGGMYPVQVDMSNGTYAIGPDNRGYIRLPVSGTTSIEKAFEKATQRTSSKGPAVMYRDRRPMVPRPRMNAPADYEDSLTMMVALGYVEGGVATEGTTTMYLNGGFGPFSGPGTLLLRNSEDFNVQSFSGKYAFLMSGSGDPQYADAAAAVSSGGAFPVISGGVLTAEADEETPAESDGTISSGVMDSAGPSGSDTEMPLEGMLQLNPDGQGYLSLSSEFLPSSHPRNYLFYIVNSDRTLVMSIEGEQEGEDFWSIAGELRRQQLSSFDNTALNGGFVMSETAFGTMGPLTLLRQGTCENGVCSPAYSEFQSYQEFRTYTEDPAIEFTVAANGRATASDGEFTGEPPFLYLFDQNEGFMFNLRSMKTLGLGQIQRQDGIEAPVSFAGEYLVGSLPPLEWWTGGFTGVVTANSDGMLEGVMDYADLRRATLAVPIEGEWSLFDAPGRLVVSQDGKYSLICYASTQTNMQCMIPGQPSLGILSIRRPYNE